MHRRAWRAGVNAAADVEHLRRLDVKMFLLKHDRLDIMFRRRRQRSIGRLARICNPAAPEIALRNRHGCMAKQGNVAREILSRLLLLRRSNGRCPVAEVYNSVSESRAKAKSS